MEVVKPIKGKNPPKNLVLPGERFVLWGDLFGDGHLWAITQTKHAHFGVAYLEWAGQHWQFREAWNAQADWLPDGVSKIDRGYSNVAPPLLPFTLEDLDGDGVPEVLISFVNDGYKLGCEIIKAKPKNAGMMMLNVTSESGEPECAGGYLITHESSGRKAWWGQNIYHKWVKGAPEEVVTWTEGNVGETDMGPTRITIETTALSPVGARSYRIPKEEDEVDGNENTRRQIKEFRNGAEGTVILRDDKPFAVIRFKWKEKGPEQKCASCQPAAEALYLFEKLTGLPWKVYGKEIYGEKLEVAKEWQSFFDVEVTGTPEGIKLLSKFGKKSAKK